MKAKRRPQRRNAQSSGPGISLFPFLAVLICTMGALVPLLMAISRTARLQAEAAAVAKIAQQSGEVQTQREDVRWRIDQLKQSRVKTESQVAEARLGLGHIEDHSRRLQNQLAQYERTLRDFEQSENNDQQRSAQSQAELEQVRSQVKTAEQQLAKAHQEAAGRSQSYAVVPYEGPNQTRRRPIYLECREDAVVLQPEGIVLTESDFEGPLGAGNPLAATLRAAREYMLAQRDFDPQAGEPYPLLLVRPEGIAAYYAARAAMKSWGFDFGYELVDDDWKLAYPPPDVRLAEVIRQVVSTARVSQARLIAAAPRQYEKRPKVVYRASPTGGFISESVPSTDNDYHPATPVGPVGGEMRERREERGQGRGVVANGGGERGSGGTNSYGENSSTPQQPLAASQTSQPLAASQPTGNAQGYPGGGTGGGTGTGTDTTGAGNSTLPDGPALTGNGTGGGYSQSSLGQGGSSSPYAGTDGSGHPLRSGGSEGSEGTGTGDGSGGQYANTTNNPYRFAGQRPGTSAPGGTGNAGIDGNLPASSPGLQSGGVYNSGNASGSGSGGVYSSGNASGNGSGGVYSSGNASGSGSGGVYSSGNASGSGSGGVYNNGNASGSGSGGVYNSGNASGDVNSSGDSNTVSGGNSSNVPGVSGTVSGSGSGVPGNAATSATNSCPNASPHSGSSSERPEGYVVGQPPREQQQQPTQPASSEPPPADAPRGYALRPGEWQPTPEPPPKMPKDDQKDEDDKRKPKPKQNLVERRGADWGLKNAARGSVGVTRPIRVECYTDRLVIISESDPAGSKVIPLGPRTVSSIDTFISGVWERMESWGMAGRGMYWRPLLQVHVAPGAERRFADLSLLLEGSGMMVERK